MQRKKIDIQVRKGIAVFCYFYDEYQFHISDYGLLIEFNLTAIF